jgi:acetoin utilization deacetylase AcuC-like enzyme
MRGAEKKVGYVYHPIFLRHDTGYHPENAGRLEAIISHLEETGLTGQLTPIEPRQATVEELALVHEKNYIAQIQAMAKAGGGWLDADTVMSADSWDAALFAAGGTIRAAELVLGGELNSAFALVRPPGHHATHRKAMGFCLFNNIAIAAKYALENLGIERAAIIDFDVHHGNGTQEAFYDDPRVLYVSTHQYPHYPGSGRIEETGGENAGGSMVNIPLPGGSGDAEYLRAFEEIIAPVIERFRPGLMLVSAGYDGHWADHLAMMQLTTTGFARMAGIIRALADKLCRGYVVFGLEGGYDLRALAASVKATFDVLRGKTRIDDPLGKPERLWPAPDIDELVQRLKKVHGL